MRIILNDQHQIELKPGQTILDAAIQAGIFLPHSCRNGRCRLCLVTVNSGVTEAILPETVLRETEHAAGQILTCCRAAVSDSVSISGARVLTVPLPPEIVSPARISSIEEVAKDVIAITLRLPPKLQFDFLPGQYVQIRRGAGVMRSYSIANAPRTDRQLDLIIGRVQNGEMSRYWFEEASPNDLLTLHGPKGAFLLEGTAGKELLMVATGTGIAPIRALLQQISCQDPSERPAKVSLVWGVRKAVDLYWDPMQLGVVTDYYPVTSRETVPVMVHGITCHMGYVQDVVATLGLATSRHQVFACGSAAMLGALQSKIVKMGVPPEAFHADYFVASD